MVKVLTTYRVVDRERYLTYDHQGDGICGAVKIKDRGTCLWSVELGYAAVVTLRNGGRICLLKPDLKVPAASGK